MRGRRTLVVVMAFAVAAVACSGEEGDDVLTVVTHDAFLVSDDVVASSPR